MAGSLSAPSHFTHYKRRGTDFLELWQEAGWGWALWNFRGDFGILDSKRGEVKYETFHGRKLDRAMLELLRAH
jgi:endoglucanase